MFKCIISIRNRSRYAFACTLLCSVLNLMQCYEASQLLMYNADNNEHLPRHVFPLCPSSAWVDYSDRSARKAIGLEKCVVPLKKSIEMHSIILICMNVPWYRVLGISYLRGRAVYWPDGDRSYGQRFNRSVCGHKILSKQLLEMCTLRVRAIW